MVSLSLASRCNTSPFLRIKKSPRLNNIPPPEHCRCSSTTEFPAARKRPHAAAGAAFFAALSMSCGLSCCSPAAAFASSGGADSAIVELFANKCAACHAGGGNVLGGPTLSEADLSANGLLSSDDVARVIALGRGRMPGWGVECAPKGACTFAARLDAGTINSLAEFVLQQAHVGWPV